MYGTLIGMERRTSKDANGNARDWYDLYLGSTGDNTTGIHVDHVSLAGSHFGTYPPVIGDVLMVDMVSRTRKDGSSFQVVNRLLTLKHDDTYQTPEMEC